MGSRKPEYDMIPLRRIGQPEDVAEAAVFLASDKANDVTNSIFPVDGGRLTPWAAAVRGELIPSEEGSRCVFPFPGTVGSLFATCGVRSLAYGFLSVILGLYLDAHRFKHDVRSAGYSLRPLPAAR